jgi:ribosomal 50S subunit-recycling heat shock protein
MIDRHNFSVGIDLRLCPEWDMSIPRAHDSGGDPYSNGNTPCDLPWRVTKPRRLVCHLLRCSFSFFCYNETKTKKQKRGQLMRLDKFLKVSRIIKRRTVASEACDKQRVHVNGSPAKPGKDLKIGDVLEIRFGSGSLKVKVLSLAETVRKEAAGDMFEILEETRNA